MPAVRKASSPLPAAPVTTSTLAADRKHIDYEAVVEDPEYLAAPVMHRGRWDYRPEQRPSNLPCDPAAARRFTEDY